MKLKRAFRKSLSAVLCAAMLLNPIAAANATELPSGVPRSPEITEEYMKDKIPAEFFIWETSPVTDIDSEGNEFHGQSPYFELKANIRISIYKTDEQENTEVENIDLGDFYTGTESSLIVGLPSVIRDKYGDRSKYSVTVFVKPLNLPEYYVMSDENYPYPLEEYPFTYNNENELKGDISFRLKEVHTQTGVIHLKAPKKVKYNIGEELDLTGGQISGSGTVNSDNGPLLDWDIFGRELTADDLDLSEFDNTKPGEYLIKTKAINFDNTLKPDELIDKIVYDSFYVTVSDVDESIAQKNTKEIKFNLNFEGEAPEDLRDIEFFTELSVKDINKERKDIELGIFKPDENNSITVKVPTEYFNYDKYPEVYFYINSNDLIYYHDVYYEFEKQSIQYITGNKIEIKIYGPYDRDHYYHYSIVHAPTKLKYKVGEELDLTGGKKAGSGYTPGKSGYWDDFGSPLTLDMLDISEFDNTKPGVYTIKGKGNVSGKFNVYVYSEDEFTQNKITFEIIKDDNTSENNENLSVNELNFNLKARVYNSDGEPEATVNCGTFEKKDDNTFSFEIPVELMEQYNEGKHIDFYAIPFNLPENMKINYADYEYGVIKFNYSGNSEEKHTIILQEKESLLIGDANLDNEVTLADAVTIMQFLSNPDKYFLGSEALRSADTTGDNDGVTSKDALMIQKYILKIIDTLPEKK